MDTPLDDALAQALVDVADGLDLETTLSRILDAAMEVTGARYGALGVLRDGGPELRAFLYRGLTSEEADLIDHLPQGLGVLGELIRHPVPLRLRHIADHPSATGFPAGHPPMDAFLGLPIRAGSIVYGNIYLTEKEGGFDQSDEDRLVMLATAAGVAISNARLFAATRMGAQWQTAIADMANAALRGEDGGTMLQLLARHSRELTECDIAVVATPQDGELMVEVLDVGPDPVDDLGDVDTAVERWIAAAGSLSPVAECLRCGEAVVVEKHPIQWGGTVIDFDRVGCFPIVAEGSTLGVLVLLWRFPHAPTGADRVGAVSAMAVQAAMSMQLETARRTEQRLLVFRDRDRIARDLHDLVVQRLFASGVSLTVLERTTELPPEARERVKQLMAEIDGTIAQIRGTIFDLREGFTGNWQVEERLGAEIERMSESLGFAPELDVDAELTTLDADDVMADTVAVVREGLSNVARHAHATTASVRVGFSDGWYTIYLDDDGVGLGDCGRRSGLWNLAQRAEARGGSCELRPRVQGGSTLLWTVPLHATMPSDASE